MTTWIAIIVMKTVMMIRGTLNLILKGMKTTIKNQEDNLDNDDDCSDDSIVQAIVASVSSTTNIDVMTEPSKSDSDESKLIAEFLENGCGCTLRNGQDCCQKFSANHIADTHSQCAALSHDELDMLILGQLMALINTSDTVVTESRHSSKHREHTYTTYSHGGQHICQKKMFQFMHGIGKNRLQNLVIHFKEFGLTPRIHGNTKRLPHHSLSFSSIELCCHQVFDELLRGKCSSPSWAHSWIPKIGYKAVTI